MAFDINAVNDIDQSTIEQLTVSHPLIQWGSGDAKMKKAGGMAYRGGFFISEDYAPADMTEYGWEKETMITRKGDEIEGFWRPELTMSVIVGRKRWVVNQGDTSINFGERDYNTAKEHGRPTGHHQYVVLLKDAVELGPFCLTLKGNAGKYFDRGDNKYPGVLAELVRTDIALANQLTKKQGLRWPYRAFWLTVGPNADAKGEPVFITVGSGTDTSNIIIPRPVGMPEKPSMDHLSEVGIERDFLTSTINPIFEDNKEWAAAWNNIKPGSSDTGETDHSEETPEAEITPEAAAAVGL